jgi:predicted RNase H-like HicB family nuclease
MRKFLVVYEKTKIGYSAYVPDLAGVIATGKTKPVVEKNIFDAIQFHLEGMKEEKIPIPKSLAESEMLVFSNYRYIL